MSDNFKQTVNLRAREEEKEGPRKFDKKILKKKFQSRSMEIDRVYSENKDVEGSSDLQKISRPARMPLSFKFYKQLAIFIVSVLVLLGAYFSIFDKKEEVENQAPKEEKWYMVKLSDASVYYGQISDVASDPIVIKNVYYNYDQLKPVEQLKDEQKETTSLRLVKRGKESHGPDGTMSIVRSQVLFMEPLKEDSKVLKAILDYEK